MIKIKNPTIGQYVFCSKYSDRDPYDPWGIGVIQSISKGKNFITYKLDGINYFQYYNCWKITPEEGESLLYFYKINVRPTIKMLNQVILKNKNK